MGTEISEPFLLDPQNSGSVKFDDSEEWKDQITIRGLLLVSDLLGTLFCIITHKLNEISLLGGIIRPVPSLNVAAGLLGFFFVKSWTGYPLQNTFRLVLWLAMVLPSVVTVLDYKLTYPSGTATAMSINSFLTNTGAELAGKQVHCLGKYVSISFCWSCFKWFFSGIGDSCGFDNFSSLGLALFNNTKKM